ncbi:hypothetical protein SPI_05977 [Niveomyces insectorum RCEF 264]|uniref:Mtf2-like C-terminal domain-containing protein n=1 Tax=Niveomyces insectorum RCEF 264 TaxID=1081102 RepID=A0A167SNB8_9HYPO|nr:hypothetical protein SPI_05977 [Niveomyces insectorum RCEF 264]
MATLFLPFLYPARIVQRPLRGTTVRRVLRSLHYTAPRRLDGNQAGNEHGNSHGHDNGRVSRSRRTLHRPQIQDPIPFELPPDVSRDLLPTNEHDAATADAAADDDVQGTITPAEQQTFQRIFHEIAQRQRYGGELRQGSRGREKETQPAERARVNAIMGEAADEVVRAREQRRAEGKQQQKREQKQLLQDTDWPSAAEAVDTSEASAALLEEQRRQMLAQFPRSLRAAASVAMGVKEAAQKQRREAGRGRDTARPTDDDGDAFADAFASAVGPGADTAAAADTTPFVSSAQEAADRAREACLRRQTKMELLMLAARSDFALWDWMEEHVFALVDELGLAGHERRQRGGPTARAPKKPTKAFQTYGPLYPALLLHGLRLFDGHFHGGQTSPLALAVLPRIKARGLASYVLGAGTPFYNQLLRIRWTRFGDSGAVFALLAEMQRAGLAFDQDTLDVVKSIEWHMAPLVGGGRTAWRTRAGDVRGGGGVLLPAAVRQMPEFAGFAETLAYWRVNVDRSVRMAGA